MWPYWLLYVAAALGALSAQARTQHAAYRGWTWGWFAALLTLALMIGLRFEVGGDWHNYFHYLDDVRGLDLLDALSKSDPGYQFLNWVSVQLDWGIFGVNLSGGVLFSWGLIYFCRTLPRPLVALAVSIPYLVIVVAMGYSRQGIALGMAMIGFAALHRRSLVGFVIWVLIGATFHKTALLLLPIAALSSTRNRYWAAVWIGVIFALAYMLLLEDSVESLYQNYVEAAYQSEGALVRLGMNALPATVVLLFHRRLQFSEAERKLWMWMSVISIGLFAMFFGTDASTAVDRIALYVLPLQLVVFSRIPDAFGRSAAERSVWVVAVLAYYAAVQFVWLEFAVHSRYWLPYRFYPFELL